MQFGKSEDFEFPQFTPDGSELHWETHTSDSGAFYIDGTPSNGTPSNGTSSNGEQSLAVQAPERKYSVKTSLPFSHYLNKESSSRYRAIVLNVSGDLHRADNAHFEIGLVEIRNPEHRSGVVHALRVSPFNVN